MALLYNNLMIFDGKSFARALESEVATKLHGKAIRIVSILAGDDPASKLYTKLKLQAAQRVGIDFVVERIKSGNRAKVMELVEKYAEDESITGIMLQLPLSGVSRKETAEVVQTIPVTKDVDGLRWEVSGVLPATVRAVIAVMEKLVISHDKHVTVIGSEGSVGRPLMHFLQKMGYTWVAGTDIGTPNQAQLIKRADVVVSCVGKPRLIDGRDIKPGCIAIDVGISQVDGHVSGDMTQEAYNAASVSVEVPGGIGPVTIACLLKNAVEMV